MKQKLKGEIIEDLEGEVVILRYLLIIHGLIIYVMFRLIADIKISLIKYNNFLKKSLLIKASLPNRESEQVVAAKLKCPNIVLF